MTVNGCLTARKASDCQAVADDADNGAAEIEADNTVAVFVDVFTAVNNGAGIVNFNVVAVFCQVFG